MTRPTPAQVQAIAGCRILYGDDGALDEIVTDAGAHLERLGERDWCLMLDRSDGSTVCVGIEGRVWIAEERQAPDPRGEAATASCDQSPVERANAPGGVYPEEGEA